ncbi:putative F-box protein At3g25750 [Quercus suber]|uniref:putative F-box protein At3g25750 n=1 Tax=Quercus suber TaxID=58331 RepID=UPI0032DF4FF1
MSEWAGLLDLILSEITRCISVYDDFVIFGAVCKSWRRVYSMKKPSSSPRPGYKAWIDIKCDSRCFYDIALYKGKFCAVNNHGNVFVCHIDGDIVFTVCITFCKEPEDYEIEDVNVHEDEFEQEQEQEQDQDQEQLRELGQEHIYEIPYVTTGFKVLKLECSTEVKSKNEYDWVNVDSLGDQALFVGDNSSMSLSASSFNGCKANCIYFTDDNDYYLNSLNGGGYDMGVFSMEDETIKQHYEGKSLSSFAPPVWYI